MANSEVVTREDLKNIFGALGEGDYGTRIDNIEETLTAPFISREYHLSGLTSTTWYSNYQVNVAVDGYTPVAFTNITFNQAGLASYWHYFTEPVANIGVANTSRSGTLSNVNIGLRVLYIKSDLLG